MPFRSFIMSRTSRPARGLLLRAPLEEASRRRMAERVAESTRAFFWCASAKASIISKGSAKSDVKLMLLGVPTIASSQKLAGRAIFACLQEGAAHQIFLGFTTLR